MKIVELNTSKESIKDYLDDVAEATKLEWHSQQAHKIAVGKFWLDQLGITEQADRDAAMKQWVETPSSFGTNCSALGQALGRESGKAKSAKLYAGM